MAVTGVYEKTGSGKATFSLNKHNLERVFYVYTDNPLDGPETVCVEGAFFGLPVLFENYVFPNGECHPFARARTIEPEKVPGSDVIWEVIVSYETPDPDNRVDHPGGGGGGGGSPVKREDPGEFATPLLALPEITISTEQKEIPIWGCADAGQSVTVNGTSVSCIVNPLWSVGAVVQLVGTYGIPGNSFPSLVTTIAQINASNIVLKNPWNGQGSPVWMTVLGTFPLTSSADEPFVPPPHRTESILNLTIKRNESLYAPHPALSLAYADTLNADYFWGAAPGTCKCQSITATHQVRQEPGTPGDEFRYLSVEYKFQFKPTWAVILLDKGTYWLQTLTTNPLTTKQVPFQDKSGNTIEGLLDGKGNPLEPLDAQGGTSAITETGKNPVWMTYTAYGSMPFLPLGLPNAFYANIA